MKTPTRLLALTLIATGSFAAEDTHAQIAPPNDAGVSMGHLHYVVRDVEANKVFWETLGGTTVSEGAITIISFPNMLVLLSEGESNGGTDGSVVNHVAFRVESIAALEAKGFELPQNDRFPGIAYAYSPEGERVEVFDDKLATNIGFEQAPGSDDPVAERHNEPLTAPIVTHHTHLYVPEDQVEAARNWYVEHFGATPGQRWQYAAADVPGMNFNFSAGATEVQAPTRGRMLDHIGFEVENLEAFCAALEAKGIEFDQPYTRLPSGLAIAFLTDPWGTYIELTEGLGEVAGQAATNPTRHDIVSSGVERHYLLHVPAGYDGEAVPLVLNLHGSLRVPEDQVEASDFGAIADREGFAVAYPAGAFASGNMQRSWNADVEDGVDDIQFVRDIVEDVATRVDIDRSRIYVTGFSGGGRMSSRLACELSDVLAAAAPVAGLQYYEDCTPAQPIPILAIHSTADPFNHYEWSDDSPAYWHVSVETAIEKWRAANGCGPRSDVSDFADNVERRAWTDCRGGSEVVLYAVDDDAHAWAGFASEVVWEFFSRH